LYFVGWVEPSPSLVGFLRLDSTELVAGRRTNLHFAGVIAKRETQHRLIAKPSPKSFFFNQTGRFLAGSSAEPCLPCEARRAKKGTPNLETRNSQPATRLSQN